MRSSTFLFGALMGIAVYRMFSGKGNMSFSSIVKGTDISQLANTAKNMMKDYTGNSSSSNQGSRRQESVRPSSSSSESSSHSKSNQHGGQASSDSKAANLKLVKEFIQSNPDVKHEVEQILKETNTVIPGL
ncbi:hypothetical protein [Paenibacillus dakarensis]|uniref:hypothetical protein n=1 Tax=Paenibacillus dakarensis TaxID=1527293 RepID=UPI0006D5AFCA|nr:hypothetical protein [Paenibacillus dakarensis]